MIYEISIPSQFSIALISLQNSPRNINICELSFWGVAVGVYSWETKSQKYSSSVHIFSSEFYINNGRKKHYIKLVDQHKHHRHLKSSKHILTVRIYLILIFTWSKNYFIRVWLKCLKTLENSLVVVFCCLEVDIIDDTFHILPSFWSHHHI